MSAATNHTTTPFASSSKASNEKTNPPQKPKLQSNLFAFFASSVPTPPKKKAKRSRDETQEDCAVSKNSNQKTIVDDSTNTNTAATTDAAAAATTPAATSTKVPPMSSSLVTSNPATSDTDATTKITTTNESLLDPNNNNNNNNKNDPNFIPPPMIPVPTPTPRTITWQSLHDNFVLLRRPAPRAMANFFSTKPSVAAGRNNHTPKDDSLEAPRTKVAAVDLDGTLVVWTCPGYPSQLSHYELWNSQVPLKLRQLYDDEGYQLLLVSNQAAIQKAHTGKKAQLVQTVMNWIAALVDRPVYAVISTQSSKKNGSFHKPNPKLWQVAQQALDRTKSWKVEESFYVGDSVDTPDDPQGGVDAKFARAVGLRFMTPTECFGPSDYDRRQRQRQYANGAELPPPGRAIQARSALWGGYFPTPMLLILCGVQGSGKSTFCETLVKQQEQQQYQSSSRLQWSHFSQDTISKGGKPGKREQVEMAARQALLQGKSVVVDRMHLTPDQRLHFIAIGHELEVPVHVLVLNPPAAIIAQRVRDRTHHPGKVQGEEGVRKALQSLEQLAMPTYAEGEEECEGGVTLISCASTPETTIRYAQLYAKSLPPLTTAIEHPKASVQLSEKLSLPMISLGTMGIGKKIAKGTVSMAVSHYGIKCCDTAPSYKNESEIGEALSIVNNKTNATTTADTTSVGIIAKIPKSVVHADQVRDSLEKTLQHFQRSSVDLLLLHWPSDVMAAGTLAEVWKEMEDCYQDGLCRGLGVCNFNIPALCQLLAQCTIKPLINQLERHPLCQQGDLMDFCACHGIAIQAHTPLGQGKETLLENPVIQAIAEETHQSTAGVVLQWNLQQGVLVVPKCRSPEHLRDLCQKRQVLSPEQMKRLDAIDCGRRFVAPPFMYGKAAYCWGERTPER